MSGEHAALSASGSAKWLSCPAALAFEAIIDEPDVPNIHSQTGTAAHEMLDRCLSKDKNPASFINHTFIEDQGTEHERAVKVDQEMIDAVELTINYVKRLTSKPGFYEQKVDYSHIAPNGWGTSDIVLEVYEKVAQGVNVNTLYVVDFKYGKGIKVNAFMNTQMLLYALGSLNTLEVLFERDVERVVLAIVQPRLDHIDEFEISLEDLTKWGEEQKPKAELANQLYMRAYRSETNIDTIDNKYFNPTEKGCQWCQGRRTKKCKAYAQQGYSAAIEGFDDLTQAEKSDLPAVVVSDSTIKDPMFLDNADLAAIYNKMRMFIGFLDGLADEIKGRITRGDDVPGLKLVPAKKPREWREDDESTVKHLRTAGLQKGDYTKQGIISPAEAEKTLKTVKPKDHERRYRKLEAAAIQRLPGAPKIIEDEVYQPMSSGDDGQPIIDDLLG